MLHSVTDHGELTAQLPNGTLLRLGGGGGGPPASSRLHKKIVTQQREMLAVHLATLRE